jgi:hypothetical protein
MIWLAGMAECGEVGCIRLRLTEMGRTYPLSSTGAAKASGPAPLTFFAVAREGLAQPLHQLHLQSS